MFHLAYDGLPFRVLAWDQWMTQLVTTPDGADSLVREHDFQVSVTLGLGLLTNRDFQRSLIKKLPDLAGPGVDVPAGAMSVPEIVLLLHARLEQPRKPLIVWAETAAPPGFAGGVNPGGPGAPIPGLPGQGGRAIRKIILLESPIRGPEGIYLPTDARHGPVCKITHTKVDQGTGSLLLGLHFATWKGIDPRYDSRALISNRWTMSVDHDEDFFATHEIEGEAYFRLDMLKAKHQTADMYRMAFMHPIPAGFKRAKSKPVFHSGGERVSYSIVDREEPTDKPGIGGYGAARVEVIHAREHAVPNAAQKLFSSVGSMLGLNKGM